VSNWDVSGAWAAAVRGLAATLRGSVALPGEPGYAMEAFSTAVPLVAAAVVEPASVPDVLAAVRLAAAWGCPVAVQATGHGTAVPAHDALMISTRRLGGVRIDPVARTARIGAGVRTGELIQEAAAFGLAPLNGAAPLVGTVGYTLGGGIGPLGRAYGFAADHVRELDIITADGQLRTASPTRHADLFWAVRGGKGNFGVITSMQLDLFPVARLYGGGLLFPGSAAAQVLHTYREWTATLPDQLSSSVALLRPPSAAALPEPVRGQLTVHVRIAYAGPATEGADLVRPLRAAGPVLVDTVTEMPYAGVSSIHHEPTEPGPHHNRSALLDRLEPATIATLLAVAGPDSGCPLPLVELRHLGGAFARTPRHPNAVGHRGAAFSLLTAATAEPGELDLVQSTQRELIQAMTPWRRGAGPCLSFMGSDEAGPRDVRSSYEDDAFRRLREVKAAYDPDNLFRVNHNIPPAGITR
jgi:FAD/FMN-containing dehydrogenase